MKILHLTTHLNAGGITKYCLLVGKRQVEEGHDVTILSAGGELEERFREAGIRTINFPIRAKSFLSPKLWMNFSRILGFIKEESFQVLHAHTRVTQVLAGALSRISGIPVVTTAHGFFKRNFGRKIIPAWGKRVVAISSVVSEELEKTHKVQKDKIRIIFNAIDFAAHRKQLAEQNPSELRRALGVKDNTVIIGCIARFVEDKGHAYLIEAAALLKKKNPNFHVILIGDGREKKNLERLVARRGLKKDVTFVAAQGDIIPYYAVIDIFVHPATFREGFGLAILEAMASKIPVVATDIWAVNSIIRNRVNGFLVPPKSADAIQKAIVEIIQNPEFAGSVAENAYQNALQNYSMDRFSRELETVYEEVIKK